MEEFRKLPVTIRKHVIGFKRLLHRNTGSFQKLPGLFVGFTTELSDSEPICSVFAFTQAEGVARSPRKISEKLYNVCPRPFATYPSFSLLRSGRFWWQQSANWFLPQ